MRIAAQFVRSAAAVIADDSGQDLIEYALLTAIIGIASLLALSALTANMESSYKSWDDAGQKAWRPCDPQPAPCS